MVILFYPLKSSREMRAVIKEICRLESLLTGQIENKAFFYIVVSFYCFNIGFADFSIANIIF